MGLTLLTASRSLALAHLGGLAGRVLFGLLSDRLFGGRRRTPLVLAGIGSRVGPLIFGYFLQITRIIGGPGSAWAPPWWGRWAS